MPGRAGEYEIIADGVTTGAGQRGLRREEPPAQGVTSSFSHSRTIAPVASLVGPSRLP